MHKVLHICVKETSPHHRGLICMEKRYGWSQMDSNGMEKEVERTDGILPVLHFFRQSVIQQAAKKRLQLCVCVQTVPKWDYVCVCVCEAGEGRFSGHPSSYGRAVWHCISGARARPRCSLSVCEYACLCVLVRERKCAATGLFGSAVPSQEHCHLATCEERCLLVWVCLCVRFSIDLRNKKAADTEIARNEKNWNSLGGYEYQRHFLLSYVFLGACLCF